MLEGLFLALMVFFSLVLTFKKMPMWIQKRLLKHKLFTDILSGAIVYVLLGAISKSIVAIVGAIGTGLLVGISLQLVEEKNVIETDNNPRHL